MNISKLTLGTRGSALARAQTSLVRQQLQAAYPELTLEEKIITTTADANQAIPLNQPTAEGSGLFTRQLEEALLSGEIDFAVHSLKDLPVLTPAGLTLAAILPRASTEDLLIQTIPGGLEALPPGAVVGTSSPRRVEYLRRARPDLKFIAVRGNVPTRLRKLAMNQREQQLDAIVLAKAGLDRLGYALELLAGEGTFIFDHTTLFVHVCKEMLPAPGQGAIAVETCANIAPDAAATYAQHLHDMVTARCVMAERLLLQYLGGGCHMALGALATLDPTTDQLHLKATYFPHAGAAARNGEAFGTTPEKVASAVAALLGDKLA